MGVDTILIDYVNQNRTDVFLLWSPMVLIVAFSLYRLMIGCPSLHYDYPNRIQCLPKKFYTKKSVFQDCCLVFLPILLITYIVLKLRKPTSMLNWLKQLLGLSLVLFYIQIVHRAKLVLDVDGRLGYIPQEIDVGFGNYFIPLLVYLVIGAATSPFTSAALKVDMTSELGIFGSRSFSLMLGYSVFRRTFNRSFYLPDFIKSVVYLCLVPLVMKWALGRDIPHASYWFTIYAILWYIILFPVLYIGSRMKKHIIIDRRIKWYSTFRIFSLIILITIIANNQEMLQFLKKFPDPFNWIVSVKQAREMIFENNKYLPIWGVLFGYVTCWLTDGYTAPSTKRKEKQRILVYCIILVIACIALMSIVPACMHSYDNCLAFEHVCFPILTIGLLTARELLHHFTPSSSGLLMTIGEASYEIYVMDRNAWRGSSFEAIVWINSSPVINLFICTYVYFALAYQMHHGVLCCIALVQRVIFFVRDNTPGFGKTEIVCASFSL